MTDMNVKDNPIVIVAAQRTPLGGFQGELAACSATELGATAIEAAIQQAKLDPELVSETLMGCVLPAGLGQAPARQAALNAGLPQQVPCTTINKVCGSGMKTLMIAYEALHARAHDIFVTGGMESMSNAPYLLPKARGGMRLGHGQITDHMFLDGLEDAYNPGQLMGAFAEATAQHYGFGREAQDEYAIMSLERANQATSSGSFTSEITPVTIKTRKGEEIISTDEQPRTARPEKIPTLKPAFAKDGTVTAANSSSISDGAAALILMRQHKANELGLKPLAKILGVNSHAQEPEWFTTAPVKAVSGLMAALELNKNNIDLFEINEAFAVVAMAAIKELDLDIAKVNINGGACALGHPLGASGARILVTLIAALRQTQQKTGITSLCIGGGEAVAVAVEII